MKEVHVTVDSYKFLPPKLAEVFAEWPLAEPAPPPWTPVKRPLSQLKLGFVTTAGIYDSRVDIPFDVQGELENPFWGDPSYRAIPRDIPRTGIGTSHLHINNDPLREDLNIAVPLDAAEQAIAEGAIADVADQNYSVMGYQPDTSEWRRRSVPLMAGEFRSRAVDILVLTPV